MEYVINLSTEKPGSLSNDYGYWAGKTYRLGDEVFPVWDREVTFRTKRYKSKVKAETMANKLYDKCGFVMSWVVESVSAAE